MKFIAAVLLYLSLIGCGGLSQTAFKTELVGMWSETLMPEVRSAIVEYMQSVDQQVAQGINFTVAAKAEVERLKETNADLSSKISALIVNHGDSAGWWSPGNGETSEGELGVVALLGWVLRNYLRGKAGRFPVSLFTGLPKNKE